MHLISINVHTTVYIFFFFNDTATTEIYTLSLHDALPISIPAVTWLPRPAVAKNIPESAARRVLASRDRKSTRLNSSHLVISYAVFCLKKKKTKLNPLFTIKLCMSYIHSKHRYRRVNVQCT